MKDPHAKAPHEGAVDPDVWPLPGRPVDPRQIQDDLERRLLGLDKPRRKQEG